MKKVKVKVNEGKLQEEMERYKLPLPVANSILSAYMAMGLPSLTYDEFKRLLNSPETVIFKKVRNGAPMTVGGLSISDEKAFDLFEKPAGYYELKQAVDRANQYLNFDWYVKNVFEIVDNEVVIKKTFIESKQEAYTLYLTSEDQVKAKELAETIFNKTKELFGEKGFDLVGFVNNAFTFQHGGIKSGTFEVNYERICQFREVDSHFH